MLSLCATGSSMSFRVAREILKAKGLSRGTERELKSNWECRGRMGEALERLLGSEEPSVRLRARLEILGEGPDSKPIGELRDEVRRSQRVRLLLSEREGGAIPVHPYSKWFGAHWVMATLADLGYPRGDRSLIPLREQVYEWLFSESHMKYVKKHEVYAGPYMEVRGLMRAHASMEGNAIYYLHALGLADDRTTALVERLLEWQWPDGGWNCDKRSRAHTSSFTESLLPMRGLAFHAAARGGEAKGAVRRAGEYFLERRLFKRKRDGSTISPRFVRLHYPCYWHYDILFGLKVMREAGLLGDRRCDDAIALLESKRLVDWGFPAEEAYYQVTRRKVSRRSIVGWDGVSRRRMNEFVTCDALSVLKARSRKV